MSAWAPVVAALGTGVIGFGGLWWQQRHRDRAATNTRRRDAYQQMIAESLSFSIRAQTLRQTMRSRSGLADRLDVALRVRPRRPMEMELRNRPPLDSMELHDWLAKGFEPINQAWSWIEIIGSAEAVEVATQLVDACADVVSVATEIGSARGRIHSGLIGLQWTAKQDEALDAATKLVVRRRREFIEVARRESEAERSRDWPTVDGLFGRESRDALGKAQIPLRLDLAMEPTETAKGADAPRSSSRGDG